MSKNPLVKEILEKYRTAWALNHSMAVMGWDQETHMPEAGASARGIANGQLAVIAQKATVDLDGLVSRAEKAKDLDDVEKGVVRVLRRSLDYYLKVPPDLVEELSRTTSEASLVWRKARKTSNFRLFRPHLGKVLELQRKVVEKLGYEGHPYNALLNLYEEDFTVRDADSVFSTLVPETKRILAKVSAAGVFPSKHPLEKQKYDIAAMERVNEGVVSMLKMPKDRFRMDVSTHPFTIHIAPDDVRITTRYEGADFKASLFGTMHESGHALYGLGIDEKLAYTPVDDGASSGVHESQSRFWENAVGRGKEFTKLIGPLLRKNLKFVSKYDDEQLYYYFNTARKSYIRVDADELTYNLHIALRYEIEKKAVAGEVDVSELPSLWDETFEEYLGIEPRNDGEGVLQDVHWSWGNFGYFPTYSLGNVVLGMIWHKLRDGEKVREAVGEGDLMQLREWLRTNIHRHGEVYSPKELQKRVFGEAYNPERLVSYLDEKFVG